MTRTNTPFADLLRVHWEATDGVASAQELLHPDAHHNPVAFMLKGWLNYADAHLEMYGTPLADDFVLGSEWIRLGRALHGLLNGDCGSLDCGAVSGIFYRAIDLAGFNEEGERYTEPRTLHATVQ